MLLFGFLFVYLQNQIRQSSEVKIFEGGLLAVAPSLPELDGTRRHLMLVVLARLVESDHKIERPP